MSTAAPDVTSEVSLGVLVAVVGSWCDRIDPAVLAGADAALAAEQVAGMVRRLQITQVALAARAKEANSFSGRFPTAAAWQAHINGVSQSQAQRGLETVERLAQCPGTAAALAAGDLSIDEAHLVTSAAVINPGSERRLVDQARKHNFADTRTAADRARHAVFSREQEQARLARMRKLRRVRELTDGDQLTWVDAHVVPEVWVMVRPVLDAFADAEFRTARQEGRRERPEAYRADGLIAALRAAGSTIGITTTPPPPPAGAGGVSSVRRPRVSSQPVVLVDAIALGRGWATDAETCELARTGTRVSVEWIEAILPTAAVDVLVHDRHDIRAHARVHRRRPIPRISTDDIEGSGASSPDARPSVVVLIDAVALHQPPSGDPLAGHAYGINAGVGSDTIAVPGTDLRMSLPALRRLVPDEIAEVVEHHLIDMRHHTSSTRHTPRPVRLAVLARDRRCTVPGCRNRQHLERDHVHDHALGGPADSANLHGTCTDHHDDKTYRDAHVVITDTERLWYPPPGTPDHPTHGPTPWRAPLGEHLTPWNLTHDSPTDTPTLPFA